MSISVIVSRYARRYDCIELRGIKLPLTSDYPYLKISLRNLLNLKTKIIISNLLLKPIWTYGVQLWGAIKKFNRNKIRIFRSKVLITNAPPYISSYILHNILNITPIKETAKLYYNNFHSCLLQRTNTLILNLSSKSLPGNPPRKLRRQ